MNKNTSIIRGLKETLFKVEEYPAPHPFYNEEGWETQPTGYKYIVNEETGQVISCKTDDYLLVPNKRIIDSVMPAIEKLGGKLVSAVMFGYGRRTIYKFRFPQNVGIGDDIINPQVIVRNSYDGSVGIHIIAGAFRKVCSNGMVIGNIVSSINNKHLVYNKNLELLEEHINLTIQKLEALLSVAIQKLMNASPVRPESIVDFIEMFPERISPYVIEYMTNNKPNNYWDLLNVATYIATHKMNRDAETTHKFESDLFTKVRTLAGIKAKA